MKTTYCNRYGDNIVFEHISDNQIKMSGYNHEWIRYAYENDYNKAYQSYMEDCLALEEPDMDLLFDDLINNQLRHLTFEEFKEEVHKDYFYNNLKLRKYSSLITSNLNDIQMVDPSGGPYISKRMDIGRYFDDNKKRIVTNIKLDNSTVIFTIN